MTRLRARVRASATAIAASAVLACGVGLLPFPSLAAQEEASLASRAPLVASEPPPMAKVPPTRAESLAARAARATASVDRGLRLIVSIADRRLVVLNGADTLMTARAAVGMDRRLTYDGESWTFRSPRGIRIVEGKSARGAWIPPDWHYAEVAREHRLRLARLPSEGGVTLDDGKVLTLRDGVAGLQRSDGSFAPLPRDEEIVFDSTLYIPPVGSANRRVEGELGEYQLDLGGGYLIHGTPRKQSIGTATTHGCVRLDDEQIEWLYAHIPIGTPVYIY